MKRARYRPMERKIDVCDQCVSEDEEKRLHERLISIYSGDDALGEHCQVPGCGAFRDARPGDMSYRPHLYDLTEAYSEVSDAAGARDTLVASSKLVGKTLANVGVIGAKASFKVTKAYFKELKKQAEKKRAANPQSSKSNPPQT